MGEFRCATRPVFDAMTVRLPLLLARAMCAACARYISAFTLIEKSRSNSSGVVSSMSLGSVTPALPTAASSPPKRSIAVFTAASFVARCATSPASVVTFPSDRAAAALSAASSRSTATTDQPARAKASAMAAPMPEQEDLHLGDADLAQPCEHRRPCLGVLLLVARDERRVVAEVQRHPVDLHVSASGRSPPGRPGGRARSRCRRRYGRARGPRP